MWDKQGIRVSRLRRPSTQSPASLSPAKPTLEKKLKRTRHWNVSKPTRTAGDCWSHLRHRFYGQCERKARPGKLTCWQHADREREAREHEKFLDDQLLATTCFHCGDPALPETRGESPRCARHSDV